MIGSCDAEAQLTRHQRLMRAAQRASLLEAESKSGYFPGLTAIP
jgi:hypothetical protein